MWGSKNQPWIKQHLKEKEKRGDMLIQRHCIVSAAFSVFTTVTLQVLQTSLMKHLSIWCLLHEQIHCSFSWLEVPLYALKSLLKITKRFNISSLYHTAQYHSVWAGETTTSTLPGQSPCFILGVLACCAPKQTWNMSLTQDLLVVIKAEMCVNACFPQILNNNLAVLGEAFAHTP